MVFNPYSFKMAHRHGQGLGVQAGWTIWLVKARYQDLGTRPYNACLANQLTLVKIIKSSKINKGNNFPY